MAKEKNDYKMEVLMKEYDQVSQGLRALILFSEKLLALGIAIMTIGLTYGLKEGFDDILLLQPVVISAVLLYAAHIYAELRAVAGYKKHLEERINGEIGENILLWEIVIARGRRRAIGQKLLYLIYLTLYLVTVHISLRIAWRKHSLGVFILISSIIIVLLIGVIVSWVEMYRALNSSYGAAQKVAELTGEPRTNAAEGLPEQTGPQIEQTTV